MLYPDWQFIYWLRSVFIPIKRDFVYQKSLKEAGISSKKVNKNNAWRGRSQLWWNRVALASIIAVVGLSAGIARGDIKVDDFDGLLKRASVEIREIGEEAIKFMSLKGIS